ncbi:hypothetical protein ETN89_18025 [Photobacterium damselae subsp. damselae]|uniref:hypothetical protein n=1 Tax=Photobacterium damselae TaxID=38293 RepID=UPI000A2F8F43|nr:hypothetical protein [Photobacterium damselae]ARR51069.1 hypothetical protein CAY62_16520 [Photobacterium damselae subsp. damselae]QAY37145.1 hypothetical protein ETN89_18025 [Photobacterium damselae subsp. damselae]
MEKSCSLSMELAAKIYMLLCIDEISLHGSSVVYINRDLVSLARITKEDYDFVEIIMQDLINKGLVEEHRTGYFSIYKATIIPDGVNNLNLTVDELYLIAKNKIGDVYNS